MLKDGLILIKEVLKYFLWIIIFLGGIFLFKFLLGFFIPLSSSFAFRHTKILSILMLSVVGIFCIYGMVKNLKKPEYAFLVLIAALLYPMLVDCCETMLWKVTKMIIMMVIYFWMNTLLISYQNKKRNKANS